MVTGDAGPSVQLWWGAEATQRRISEVVAPRPQRTCGSAPALPAPSTGDQRRHAATSPAHGTALLLPVQIDPPVLRWTELRRQQAMDRDLRPWLPSCGWSRRQRQICARAGQLDESCTTYARSREGGSIGAPLTGRGRVIQVAGGVAPSLAREAVDEEDAAAQDVNDNAAEVEVDDAEAKEVNSTTRAKVAEFAQSQDVFFARRGESYARLTNLGDRTSADGEIWRTCSSVNG
nr:unnamed protein product [Digitaria exilis]